MSAAGSQALVSALEIVGVLVLSGAGTWWVIRRERKHPSSYTRGGDLAWWGLLSAEEQEAADLASLDMAEQAEMDARADAAEAADLLAVETAARINVLNHP
jgi:hypothetical protein